MYFKDFPLLTYIFRFGKKDELRVLKDISLNVRVRKEILNNVTIYDDLDLEEGDTPEKIAYRLYGDPQLHWVIMLVNNRFSYLNDFPMPVQQLEDYIGHKYGYVIENERVPFTLKETVIEMDVHAPLIGTPIRARLHNKDNPAISVETTGYTSASDTWHTVVFDFDYNTPLTPVLDFNLDYNILTLMPFYGAAPPIDQTYLFNNIRHVKEIENENTTLSTYPMNFDDIGVFYTFNESPGISASIISDPHEDRGGVLKITKRQSAGPTAGTEVLSRIIVRDAQHRLYNELHYETPEGVVVDKTHPFARPISNFDYEFRENEKKRRIKVINPKLLDQVLLELENALKESF